MALTEISLFVISENERIDRKGAVIGLVSMKRKRKIYATVLGRKYKYLCITKHLNH